MKSFKWQRTVEVPLNDGYFKALKEKGEYYYVISAYWESDDGKSSNGDTSSVFVIAVQ